MRKPLLFIGMQKGWGKTTCQFCDKKVIAYNYDRHVNSKSHLNNMRKKRAIQVDNDLTVTFSGGIDDNMFNELESIAEQRRQSGKLLKKTAKNPLKKLKK